MIAIAAIISPVIVTIVNNVHSNKLRELEIKTKHFQNSQDKISTLNDLVTNFVAAANVLNTYEQTGGWQLKANVRNQFVKSGSKLLPYLSPDYQKLMQDWLKLSQIDDKSAWFSITKHINNESVNLLNDVKKNAYSKIN